LDHAAAMQPLRLLFGQRIADLRRAAGYKQDEFAERCGFARSYMSRIETGGANPSLDAIETLALALKVPVKDLFPES
jgi:transcriptional regulator with XRE-family HTH domain